MLKRALVPYTIALILSVSVLLTAGVYKLWKADLEVPMYYTGGDSFLMLSVVKCVVQNGWFLHDPLLGAPGTLDTQDYPRTDLPSLLIIRLLALFISNYALVANILFLLTFPLTTFCSFYVLRRFHVSDGSAIVFSLLYTFLPYHLLRGEAHLFLACYYLVPLIVMIALWICNGEAWSKQNRRISILICAVMGTFQLYYTFFGGFLLVAAGVYAAIRNRQIRHIAIAVALTAVMVCTMLLTLLPNIIYTARHGRNTNVAQRTAVEAERYSLDLVATLLPIGGHRLDFMIPEFKEYRRETIHGEVEFSYLGILGDVGFLLLVAGLMFAAWRAPQWNLLKDLGVLNLSILLLGVSGGLGTLFSFLFYSQFRGYNRISVYLAFFSLFAVAVLFDRLSDRMKSRTRYILLAAILCIGMLDQTRPYLADGLYGYYVAQKSDADFVHQIEASVPPGSMIFQLPYVSFPEAIPRFRMQDYDHLRGYLNSNTLRWSYGAMRGRENDAWIKEVSELPPGEMIRKIREAGFQGIYIDRNGYKPGNRPLESAIAAICNVEPISSDNRHLRFYKLPDR